MATSYLICQTQEYSQEVCHVDMLRINVEVHERLNVITEKTSSRAGVSPRNEDDGKR